MSHAIKVLEVTTTLVCMRTVVATFQILRKRPVLLSPNGVVIADGRRPELRAPSTFSTRRRASLFKAVLAHCVDSCVQVSFAQCCTSRLALGSDLQVYLPGISGFVRDSAVYVPTTTASDAKQMLS